MEGLIQDVRYGFRMLRRSPGFTSIAVITLALGIGANTAVFSVVNSVLVNDLPYKNPKNLVLIWSDDRDVGNNRSQLSFTEGGRRLFLRHGRTSAAGVFCWATATELSKRRSPTSRVDGLPLQSQHTT
jgi:hypothetical protein